MPNCRLTVVTSVRAAADHIAMLMATKARAFSVSIMTQTTKAKNIRHSLVLVTTALRSLVFIAKTKTHS
jgi:hypothetical protein